MLREIRQTRDERLVVRRGHGGGQYEICDGFGEVEGNVVYALRFLSVQRDPGMLILSSAVIHTKRLAAEALRLRRT